MNATTHYGPTFKAWQSKQLGSKPTTEMLTTAHAFGRPGKQSLALAMAMRPEGVTAAQIQIACGAPQNNHRRGLISEGLFKREAMPANELGHTVYKITLTAKGNTAMKRRADAEANAVASDKAQARKPKARKPRAKPAKVLPLRPTVEAPVTADDALVIDQTEQTPAQLAVDAR